MWSPRQITQHYTWPLFWASFLLMISSANFAFDNQAYNQTQAMAAFEEFFGDCSIVKGKEKCVLPSWWLSLANSTPDIGKIIGLYIGSWASYRFGRKKALFGLCIWSLAAVTVLITSRGRVQVVIGRILNYGYAGAELAVIPIYQGELVPGAVRGFAVGSYQLSFAFGGIIMSCICLVTSKNTDNSAWQIPFGLMYIIPTFIAIMVWFIPESPRWLVANDKLDHAANVLRKIRRDDSEEAISHEINTILLALEVGKDKGGYKDAFTGTNRRRTLIAMGVAVFIQATGQGFTNNYGAIFIKQLNSINPFKMQIVNNVSQGIGNVICMILSDIIGRRPIMMSGTLVQAGALLTMGGLGTIKNPGYPIRSGIAAMVPIFGFGYGYGWAGISHVVVAELPQFRCRDITQRLAGWVTSVINFLVTFTLPYLLNEPYGGLHSRVGFIYGSVAVIACVYTYFAVPEGKGRSLEEMDQLFLHHVSARESAKWVAPDTEQDLEEMAGHEIGKAVEVQTEKV